VAPVYVREGSEPVVLQLEEPIGIVERLFLVDWANGRDLKKARGMTTNLYRNTHSGSIANRKASHQKPGNAGQIRPKVDEPVREADENAVPRADSRAAGHRAPASGN
jgi:hypothetical protein